MFLGCCDIGMTTGIGRLWSGGASGLALARRCSSLIDSEPVYSGGSSFFSCSEDIFMLSLLIFLSS